MPLLNFHATNLPRAFILNALASSLVILLALVIKGKLDTYTDADGRKVIHTTSWKSVGITFIVTFLASIGAFVLLYLTFGYGGGMLSAN